jgi:hypothetical protein
MPGVRRVDDVVAGTPFTVGDRVVTPVARRRGWVVGARNGAVFSLQARPQSVTVESPAGSQVVPFPNRHRYVMLAVWSLAALLVIRVWRGTMAWPLFSGGAGACGRRPEERKTT